MRWPREESRWRRAQAICLALDGMSSPEIAATTGLSRANVMQVCHRAGVPIAVPEPKAEQIDAAMRAVAAGACPVDAAADHGIALNTLYRTMRKRGLGVQGEYRGRRRDGRSLRAARSVIAEHISASEAAARYRCAPSAVAEILELVRERLVESVRHADGDLVR